MDRRTRLTQNELEQMLLEETQQIFGDVSMRPISDQTLSEGNGSLANPVESPEHQSQSTEVGCITLPADESVLDLDPLPTVNKDQTHLDLCGVNVTITPLYDAVSGTNGAHSSTHNYEFSYTKSSKISHFHVFQEHHFLLYTGW